MSLFTGAVVLITGASSGIGVEIARQTAARVKALVLVARRIDRLEQLKEELVRVHPRLQVHVCGCDLADRDAVREMLSSVERATGGVDVLVNNAGFGDLGVFDRADWDKTERMITLNVTALTYLTHRLVPGMVERARGGILNVSSGFGLAFMPGFSVYIGTKHYVTGFTESLRLDLAGTGVTVTQVCPGPVKTEFKETLGNFTGADAPGFVEISAAECARAALRGFERGRALVIPGFVIRVLMLLNAISPRWLKRLLYAPAARKLRQIQKTAEERTAQAGEAKT
ncbi:SDR family oxidoreductase [Pendulispora rubella]|uniref:SDR family oxidoreductase n=1 Tax=Pendulispora rubella TaxID=2741070 RepID=A0ABZ2L175_9BACT